VGKGILIFRKSRWKTTTGRRRGTNCPKILPLKIRNKEKFSSGDEKQIYNEQSEYLSERPFRSEAEIGSTLGVLLFPSELLLLLVTKVNMKT